MPSSKKIAPSSSNSSSSLSSNDQDKTVFRNFKLIPAGHGSTRNTRVETNSLSSYSLPEETSRPNEAGHISGTENIKLTHDISHH